MEEYNPFEEFVEESPEMEELEEIGEDKEAKMIDEALAKIILEEGLTDFNWDLRNIVVQTLKESMKMALEYPLYVYLDALFKITMDAADSHLTSVRCAFIYGMVFEYLTKAIENAKDGE